MVARPAAAPLRSCTACRREADKAALLRFVCAPDGTVVPDLEQKLPGRGAYTCLSRACLLQAVSRRGFQRAFKGKADMVDAQELVGMVQQQMERRISGYLSLAAKAGALISGGEAVERVLKGAKPVYLLLLAGDISPTIAEKWQGMADRLQVPVVQVFNKDVVGQLMGKESERSAVAVMSDGFARSLIRECERYRTYLEEESGR